MKYTLIGVLAFASICALALAAGTQPASRPATLPTLRPLSFHRTGGFAGTDDRITITPAGKVTVAGKLMGKGEAQLDAKQMQDLAALFEDWGKLKDKYVPKDQVFDGFEIDIQYGNKTVHTSDGADNVPASLQSILKYLEDLAQNVVHPNG